MSSLARYKKPGGFKQLLMLIETSNKKKQDQLLNIVQQEDQKWSHEIKQRMLTIDKVLTWDAESIEKVMSQIPPASWITSLFHLEEADRNKRLEEITQFQGHTRQREAKDTAATLSPNVGEIEAAQLLVLKKVRDLQASGEFKPETKDPLLTLSELDKVVL